MTSKSTRRIWNLESGLKEVEYLIVGGGIAGTTAAETIRAHDAASRIVLISREPHPLYARLELSKSDVMLGRTPKEKLWLRTLAWYTTQRIETFFGSSVAILDATMHRVTLGDGAMISYEKLLLALGVQPRTLDIPGAHLPSCHSLCTLDNLSAIQNDLFSQKKNRSVVLVGGGFIAFEAAEACRNAGLATTLVMRDGHMFFSSLGTEAAEIVQRTMQRAGVHLIANERVSAITGSTHVEGITTESGRTLPADSVILAVGTTCPAAFVKEAGGTVRRGIITDTALATTLPDVFAAGDCAEFFDKDIAEHVMLGSWTNALLQGKTAAQGMLGNPTPFHRTSMYTTTAFGLAIVFLGNTAKKPRHRLVVRGNLGATSVTQLTLHENRVVGAVLINRNQDLAALTRCVREHTDISGKETLLSDASFDLNKLFA